MIQTPLRRTPSEEIGNESYTYQHMMTKFTPPVSMHTTRTRRRLLTLLQKGLLYPLTLISAPAGFGKTTLLMQWVQVLADGHIPAIWMSLDENDNEPLHFWNLILAAFAQKLPQLNAFATHKGSLSDLLTLLINACAAEQETIVLVLDDYHTITDSTIQGQMAYFVERLPSHVHIVLATRVEPQLPLARLRARDQIVEVRMDALRFTVEEATPFLHEDMHLSLTQEEIIYLVGHVDGWIAGLRLAGYALCEQGSVKDVYAAARGSQRYLQDYIVDEILLLQEEATQSFLLHTSILSRFSISLCNALLPQHNSWQLLHSMERANLFLIIEDEEGGWYSYQPLFAEALRCRLRRSEGSEAIALLHRRASCWYEEHSFLADAVEHLCVLHDWEHAADVLEHMTQQHLNGHDWQDASGVVQDLLARLPEALVQSRPLLHNFRRMPVPSVVQAQKAHKVVDMQQAHPYQQLIDPLSARELEVLQLIAQGAQNGEIANDLVIAIGTVKRHVSNILSKLQADNRTHAIACARSYGLLC